MSVTTEFEGVYKVELSGPLYNIGEQVCPELKGNCPKYCPGLPEGVSVNPRPLDKGAGPVC